MSTVGWFGSSAVRKAKKTVKKAAKTVAKPLKAAAKLNSQIELKIQKAVGSALPFTKPFIQFHNNFSGKLTHNLLGKAGLEDKATVRAFGASKVKPESLLSAATAMAQVAAKTKLPTVTVPPGIRLPPVSAKTFIPITVKTTLARVPPWSPAGSVERKASDDFKALAALWVQLGVLPSGTSGASLAASEPLQTAVQFGQWLLARARNLIPISATFPDAQAKYKAQRYAAQATDATYTIAKLKQLLNGYTAADLARSNKPTDREIADLLARIVRVAPQAKGALQLGMKDNVIVHGAIDRATLDLARAHTKAMLDAAAQMGSAKAKAMNDLIVAFRAAQDGDPREVQRLLAKTAGVQPDRNAYLVTFPDGKRVSVPKSKVRS